MDMIYIAVNGDNVGESIGNAIASDNHDELEKITGGLKGAHDGIKEWVESVGGKAVTESGDEGIYKIPAEAYDEDQIDNIRSMYSEQAGTTVTVGIGETMSEASKALIYGKLNEKDQVVEYDSHIDDYIASHDEDEEEDGLPTDEELTEESEGDMEEEAGMADDEESDEMPDNMSNNNMEDGGDEDEIPEMEETAIEGESASEETDETQDDQGIDEEIEEPVDEDITDETEIAEEDDDIAPEEKIDDVVAEDEVPEHEADLSPDEKAMHDATEDMTDEEEIAQEQLADQAEEAGMEAPIGEDEDTEEIDVPADQVDGDYGSEEMAEAQPEHELGMDENEEFIHDAEENRADELDEDNIEADEEMPEEGDDQHGMISDMIHANMEGEDGEQDNAELKQKIMQSLQSFKQNKMMIEQAKQQDPEFYGSIMNMLTSMIEMAKQLNMNPEQDLEDQMAQDELPYADEEMEEPEELTEQEMKKFENWRKYHARKDAEKKAKQAASKKRINGKKPLDHALEEVERKMKAESKKKKTDDEKKEEKKAKKK